MKHAPTFAGSAKGKIERRHDYWQKRLVPLLAADHIELVGDNHLLDQLVPHANQHKIHRELGQTPHAAGVWDSKAIMGCRRFLWRGRELGSLEWTRDCGSCNRQRLFTLKTLAVAGSE